MSAYKISDIIELLTEMYHDGFQYVDVIQSSAIPEYNAPPSLALGGVGDFSITDYPEIEACDVPNDDSAYRSTPESDDLCHDISFTFDEINTIFSSLTNSLTFYEECLSDKSCSLEEKKIILELKARSQSLLDKMDSVFTEPDE